MATATRKPVRNLSGSWQGQYRYSSGQAVPFLAHLAENEGAISGDTVEPKDGGRFAFRTARVSGGHTGSDVHFTKRYAPQSVGYNNPVAYQGQLSDDRKTITGQWRVSGVSGTFEMQREADIETGEEVHARVSSDEPVRDLAPVPGGAA